MSRRVKCRRSWKTAMILGSWRKSRVGENLEGEDEDEEEDDWSSASPKLGLEPELLGDRGSKIGDHDIGSRKN